MNVNVVVGFIAGMGGHTRVKLMYIHKHTPPRCGDGDECPTYIHEAAIKSWATTKESSSSTDTRAPSFLAYWSLSQSYIERAGAEEARAKEEH